MNTFRTLTAPTVDTRFYPQDRQIPSHSAGGRHLARRFSRLPLNLYLPRAQLMLIGFDVIRLPAKFPTNLRSRDGAALSPPAIRVRRKMGLSHCLLCCRSSPPRASSPREGPVFSLPATFFGQRPAAILLAPL